MFNWQKFPFVRFAIAFVSGIICYHAFSPPQTLLMVFFFGLALLLSGLWLVQRKGHRESLRLPLAISGFLLLFLFGNALTAVHTDLNRKEHLIGVQSTISGYEGIVSESPQEKTNSFKLVLNVRKVLVDSVWQSRSGKVLLYFQKSRAVSELEFGDKVLVYATLQRTMPATNPDAFDYKSYLANHNIYHQGYVRDNQFVQTGKDMDRSEEVVYYAGLTRLYLDRQLARYFINKREGGIAEALVLGVKDDLENEIREIYSEVGAMHILAVSGLHVGLVYQIFLWIFGWTHIDRKKAGRMVQAGLLIGIIWIYAFVTGLSPSVLRAATMFSFIIVGKAMKRNANIYNTLAVSAFVLLCFNPYLVMEAGFQLSYLAVLGIVYLQPKIYALLDVKYIWLDKVWVITTVSIAAQIATSPISIYYFHQFPNYFLASNLVAIPAATGILGLGLLDLACSWSGLLSGWITRVLEKLIWLTNEVMAFIAKLPGSVSKELEITEGQMLLMYAAIIMFLVFLETRRLKYFAIVLVCALGIAGIYVVNKEQNRYAREIIVYDVKGKTAIGFREGHQIAFLNSDSLYQDEKRMKMNVLNHWQKSGIDQIQDISLDNPDSTVFPIEKVRKNHIVCWNGKKILLLDKPLHLEGTQGLHYFDWIVLRDNVYLEETDLDQMGYGRLIVDSSCRKWYLEHHTDFLKRVNAWVVSRSGALVIPVD